MRVRMCARRPRKREKKKGVKNNRNRRKYTINVAVVEQKKREWALLSLLIGSGLTWTWGDLKADRRVAFLLSCSRPLWEASCFFAGLLFIW